MRLHIAATTAVTLLLAPAAFAQNPPFNGNQPTEVQGEQNTTQAQQSQIERTLSGAGFTDIEMITTSFLVRAKNPNGDPVMMIVDPTSMTATIIGNQEATPDEDTTTGSAPPR